jgi:hydroxybutyrate-dimer hydrolase
MVKTALLLTLVPVALVGLATEGASSQLPPFVDKASLTYKDYNGIDDDLLTAGLGQFGLARTEKYLAREGKFDLSPDGLRRLAIFRNYTAIVDTATGGGYGVIFGPSVDAALGRRGNDGKVAGREYRAFVKPEDGIPATAVVQIPADFDFDAPCIVAAPSSGSRGVYGAISTAEAAFNYHCAVALTDKGSNGFHDLDGRWHFNIAGELVNDLNVQFRADTSGAKGSGRSDGGGPRIAFKHAHSGDNPERNWGQYVLLSIELALWALNDYARETKWPKQLFTADNTTVVAAGVSNGGGSVLRAAEQDRDESPLIDAVVASEPQVQPVYNPQITIDDRGCIVTTHSRSFFDIVTLMDVYAPAPPPRSCPMKSRPPRLSPDSAASGRIAAKLCIGEVSSRRRMRRDKQQRPSTKSISMGFFRMPTGSFRPTSISDSGGSSPRPTPTPMRVQASTTISAR